MYDNEISVIRVIIKPQSMYTQCFRAVFKNINAPKYAESGSNLKKYYAYFDCHMFYTFNRNNSLLNLSHADSFL